ncbi:carbon-nitrogen hydrolase family protein [Nocardioides acrostichi]|uniref:Carbon-nitrogen hydrolase family protein n=1 Tax=Nocardioides acrostichi TaxID=2784339 RepID=A0A930UY71_9ACTN|nr:carbon-nitrogen hydrolase family protein [Nocardioides acrostichi]MBF4160170.1 carbon-nitrogen hydrolase family protein [Nocardioides acrostichi]
MTLRVAVGQAEPAVADIATNVGLAADLTARAGAQGARLLVLPEAFLTGYHPDAFDAVVAGGSPTHRDLDGPLLAPLREACADSGCTVLVSTPLVTDDGRLRLAMVRVDPEGRGAAVYAKQHVDRSERAWFSPGDPAPVVLAIQGVRVGLAICYDTRFPEHAAAAARAGAEVYAVSAAYLEGSTRGREVSLPARALDHGMYVVAAAALGPTGTVGATGGSCVLDPEGRELATLGAEPGIAVAEVDLDALAEVRSRQTMHADRML